MNLNTLLDLAIMIFAGMFCGRMAKHVHLPNVTGYLVAGLLIGPSVFGLLSEDFLTTINIISDVALGFIAFSIGNEFKMSYFKRVGVAPIVIACLESLFAVVFVVLGLLIARQPLPFSLVLGAIAAATAPAATIMVIKQYRAKGPVTETLLSVVAIDDAADRAHLLTVQHHKNHLVFLVRRVHQHPQGAKEPKLVVRLELLRHAAAVQNGRAGDMFLLQRREKLIQTFQLVQNDHQ